MLLLLLLLDVPVLLLLLLLDSPVLLLLLLLESPVLLLLEAPVLLLLLLLGSTTGGTLTAKLKTPSRIDSTRTTLAPTLRETLASTAGPT